METSSYAILFVPVILLQFITKKLALYSESIPASISHFKMLLYLKATFR